VDDDDANINQCSESIMFGVGVGVKSKRKFGDINDCVAFPIFNAVSIFRILSSTGFFIRAILLTLIKKNSPKNR